MIPYSKHFITREDVNAVRRVLDNGLLARGERVTEFENAVADLCGKHYAVATSSGTAALHAAVHVSGAKEVVSPTLTFNSIANVSLATGSELSLLDVDLEKLHSVGYLDSYGEDATAFVPMDYAGLPWNSVVSEHDDKFVLIRDACHSLGATIDGEGHVKYDDMACFSFHPSKQVACGEGGMVVTDIQDYAVALREFIDCGRKFGLHTSVGLNYHMDEMSAALGLSQLSRLHENLEYRRDLAGRYHRHWENDARIILPVTSSGHAWHLYVIRLADHVECDVREFQSGLKDAGIIAARHYKPIHQQPLWENQFQNDDFPNANHAYERALSIPMYFGLTDFEQKYVMDSIDKLLDRYCP